jgi:hypothetical protein
MFRNTAVTGTGTVQCIYGTPWYSTSECGFAWFTVKGFLSMYKIFVILEDLNIQISANSIKNHNL